MYSSAASFYITFNIFFCLETTLFPSREALGKQAEMIDSHVDFLFQGSHVIGLSQARADNCPWTFPPRHCVTREGFQTGLCYPLMVHCILEKTVFVNQSLPTIDNFRAYCKSNKLSIEIFGPI